MIEVYFSTDGKQTIHVQTETTEELNKLLPYAKALYKRVCSEFGTKVQMWGGVMNGNGKIKQANEENYPLCSTHKERMVLREGPYGNFVACPVKKDGDWCRAKPTRASLKLQEAISKVV